MSIGIHFDDDIEIEPSIFSHWLEDDGDLISENGKLYFRKRFRKRIEKNIDEKEK